MTDRPNRKGRVLRWSLLALAASAVSFGALHLSDRSAPVEIPTARIERRDYVDYVRARGELRSARSATISAPATPNLTIVRLAESGKPVRAGQVVVEFDSSAQEDLYIQRTTAVREADSEIKRAEAQHSIADEQNAMAIMQAQYNVERAELEASKQEILSEIEGLKNRVDVGISKGVLAQAETAASATDISQTADLRRIAERKDKAQRDLATSQAYLREMVLRAPTDGILHVMENNRASGQFGTSRPPFQEGDSVWTGAVIAEIPDLSSLVIDFRVDELDRGRVEIGQPVRARVDAVPDLLLEGEVDWLSPIATLVFRRFPPEKSFPARSSIREIDPRLRPGMSISVEIVVERRPDELIIPAKAGFQVEGKPAVYVQRGTGFVPQLIEVLARNSSEIVVRGVEEGQVIALENPELGGGRR